VFGVPWRTGAGDTWRRGADLSDYVKQFEKSLRACTDVPGGFLGNVRDQMSQTATKRPGRSSAGSMTL